MKLSFSQNDPPMGKTFWKKDNLIKHILFELWLIMILSPVANFAQQSLLSLDLFPLFAHCLLIYIPSKQLDWMMKQKFVSANSRISFL